MALLEHVGMAALMAVTVQSLVALDDKDRVPLTGMHEQTPSAEQNIISLSDGPCPDRVMRLGTLI